MIDTENKTPGLQNQDLQDQVTFYEDLGQFFGLTGSLSALDEPLRLQIVETMVDRSGIEEILPDRPPFLMLDKLAIFRNQLGGQCALSLSYISREDCAGHISGGPLIPLIHFSKVIALTGRFLSAYVTGRDQVVAEVVRTGRVESLLSLADLQHATPPASVLSFAEIARHDKRRVVVNSSCWIIAADRFVPAGRITDLDYSIIPRRIFLRALHGRKNP